MAPDLRDSFDSVAEQYHLTRPGYPRDLIDALVVTTGIRPGSLVLEIGPGTGQATADLLGRGAAVTAVERGSELSAVLEREHGGSALDVVTAGFEEWTLPPSPFDVIASFTAWHWLDPRVRTEKAAQALQPGGWLATVTTTHVVDEVNGFFDDMQPCYQQWMGSDARRPPRSDEITDDADEVDGSRWFDPAERLRFTQDIVYSTEAFIGVLGTYSNHLALSKTKREALFTCLAELMADHYGGHVTKRYLYELRMARRRTT